jgi:hypothetical protein
MMMMMMIIMWMICAVGVTMFLVTFNKFRIVNNKHTVLHVGDSHVGVAFLQIAAYIENV